MKKKIYIAIGVSMFIMLTNYFLCNTSVPLPNEISVLQGWDNIKRWLGTNRDSVPDEVLLVNVAYDKELVDYAIDYGNYTMPVGQLAITDRQKLYDFLSIAHNAGNYKYIMLDIFFEKGSKSPIDSALFSLIASMDRIVIPMHEQKDLLDSILYNHAAYADYTMTQEETSFSRFKYLHNDKASIPLRMYQEICGKDIRRWAFLYFSDGWLCRNGVTLKMPIRVSDRAEPTSTEGGLEKSNALLLGADLLDLDVRDPIAGRIDGKIIAIGDFEADRHDTYLGRQPGSLICLNAYYALVRGDHILLGRFCKTLLFYIFTGIVYFLLCLVYLNELSLAKLIKKDWLENQIVRVVVAILSTVSVGVLFWIIASIAYISSLDIVYNFFLPMVVFGLLDIVANIRLNYLQNKNENKRKINLLLAPNDADSDGSQLQNSLPELPKAVD